MAKYRKKPLVIEAEQWFEGKDIEGVVDETANNSELIKDILSGKNHKRVFFETLEGKMSVNEGDWIITGIKGEKYCCRDDIFQETYEEV